MCTEADLVSGSPWAQYNMFIAQSVFFLSCPLPMAFIPFDLGICLPLFWFFRSFPSDLFPSCALSSSLASSLVSSIFVSFFFSTCINSFATAARSSCSLSYFMWHLSQSPSFFAISDLFLKTTGLHFMEDSNTFEAKSKIQQDVPHLIIWFPFLLTNQSFHSHQVSPLLFSPHTAIAIGMLFHAVSLLCFCICFLFCVSFLLFFTIVFSRFYRLLTSKCNIYCLSCAKRLLNFPLFLQWRLYLLSPFISKCAMNYLRLCISVPSYWSRCSSSDTLNSVLQFKILRILCL